MKEIDYKQFNEIKDGILWINKNEVEVLSISPSNGGVTIFYFKKKYYQCSLDEIQCSEECHGNPRLKEKCKFCKIITL